MSSVMQIYPTPVQAAPAPSPELLKEKWELGVSLLLHSWKALTDAVDNEWGGPDSADKRDFLCGAVADLFDEWPDTDEYDIEVVLVDYMQDEFSTSVEDDSAFPLGQKIMALRAELSQGNFASVDAMHRAFLARPRKVAKLLHVVEVVDEEEPDSESEEEDVEMEEAVAAAAEPKKRLEPVVDVEGFELVQKKNGRRRQ